MTDKYSVWFFQDSNEVLLTDDNSPPVGASLVGLYDRPDLAMGWGEADEAAKKKATETGALIIYSATFA